MTQYRWTTTLKNVNYDPVTDTYDLDEELTGDIIPIYKDANVHAHKLPNTTIPTYEFINIKKH
jgi:hypothetical protein